MDADSFLLPDEARARVERWDELERVRPVPVRIDRNGLRRPLSGGDDELAGEGLVSGIKRGHVDARREAAKVEASTAGLVEGV